MSRLLLWALLVAGALDALGILLFFQTREPLVLLVAVVLTTLLVLGAFLVEISRRGIPVRVVQEAPAK